MRCCRAIGAAAAVVVCCGGCLKRTISITSDPEGALVWLNDVEVGHTPVETDFTFFGGYDARVRLDGFEPMTVTREAVAPFYEYPPIDLLADALPMTISTRVKWHFDLQPTPEAVAAQTGDQALKERAEQALVDRAEAVRGQLGGGSPSPSPSPAPAAPPSP